MRVEWTWEERPVGEHEWDHEDGPRRCVLCGRNSHSVYQPNKEHDCPSRMERRRVTPWEPVPTEEEEAS